MANIKAIPRLVSTDPLELPAILVGGAVFGTDYSTLAHLRSEEPTRVLLAALQYGMCAIDTSPYYKQSEAILGEILGRPEVRQKFPRSSYRLLTKCGRYGPTREDFDYSPDRIRTSVQTSCERLQTDYLDAVYLHDPEFVAEDVGGASEGGLLVDALSTQEQLLRYGLAAEQGGMIHGPGDRRILAAIKTLFQLKDERRIRAVGIGSLPLPLLLRLARLVKTQLGRPLDLIQSYAHLTLQNELLRLYIPLLKDAGVRQIINASPLSMGLLRADAPPAWHPAPPELRRALENTLPDQTKVALRFGLRAGLEYGIPTVVGVSTVKELEAALEAFWEGHQLSTAHAKQAARLRQIISTAGFKDWIWAQPPATPLPDDKRDPNGTNGHA